MKIPPHSRKAFLYLDRQNVIAAYLTSAVNDPNPNVFLDALRDVITARGLSGIASAAGLKPDGFHKLLRKKAKPSQSTLGAIILGAGMRSDQRSVSAAPGLTNASASLKRAGRHNIKNTEA